MGPRAKRIGAKLNLMQNIVHVCHNLCIGHLIQHTLHTISAQLHTYLLTYAVKAWDLFQMLKHDNSILFKALEEVYEKPICSLLLQK